MAYADLLKDPRWQKKRLEVMERDKFTCRSCGDTKSTLNVHHAYYEKGKMPWEYPDESLVTWCEECHDRRQKMQNYMLKSILNYGLEEMYGLYSFVTSPIIDQRSFFTAVCLNEEVLPSLNILTDIVLWNARNARSKMEDEDEGEFY